MADQQTPSTAIPIRVALVDTNGAIIGSLPVTIADNGDFALGSVADAAWVSGNGTAIALLKTIASGGGGGSGPVTIIDGGDVAEGAKADAAWSGSGSGTVISILKKIATAGGSAVTIADAADTVEGALADAAVTTDANGTVSGKLRGLVKIFADVWDSVNHRLNVALPAATVTTLTPPAAITGFALDATLTTTNTKLDTLDADIKANVSLATSANVIGHVVVDTAPTTAVTNTGLTDLDAAIGTEDSTTIPSKAVMIAGKSSDAIPMLEALPLGPQGRSLLTEPIAPSAFDTAMLRELRLLRQAFQDWTGTNPREDPIQVNS